MLYSSAMAEIRSCRRLPMLRAFALALALSALALRRRGAGAPALHPWIGRGRRQLLHRRERHLRVGQPRPPRRPPLQPRGDAGLALQPRVAARGAARLRHGAVRLAEVRLPGHRPLRRRRPDDDLRSVMSLYPESLTILARPGRRHRAHRRHRRQAGGHRPARVGPPRHRDAGPRPRSGSPSTTSRRSSSCPPAARSTSSAPGGSTPRS